MIFLVFNTLSRFIIVFLPRYKDLLIPWLQSPSTVTLETKKIKSVSFYFFSLLAMRQWDQMPWSSFFQSCFKSSFSSSSFILIRRLFSSYWLSVIRVVSSEYTRLLIFLLAILIPGCALSSPEVCMMSSAYFAYVLWFTLPWVGKIPRRKWQTPPVFLALENPMDRGACSPWGCKSQTWLRD